MNKLDLNRKWKTATPMKGRITRNAHQKILLLAEIDARRVVLIGTTISNRCKIPNIIKNPNIAFSTCPPIVS